MKIDLNINEKVFNKVYLPYLLDYSKRYEVYFGGAGSGKSQFVFQKAIIKALKDKRKILVVRKTAKANSVSTFTLLLDILSSFKILSFCKINKTNYTVVLPNESVFLFVGCDDSEKLKSIAGITDIICEECTELDATDVDQLDLRLRARASNLQMFFMMNPISKANWTYKRWFAPDVLLDDNTFILKTTFLDNVFLPQSFIDSLLDMKQRNPTYYKIYAEGEFASLDKLVLNNWRIEDFDKEDVDGALAIGLDFGYINDLTALVSSLIDEENKTIYVFDEWTAKGLTNDKIAKAILERGYAKSVIIADSAEQKSIDEIKNCGVYKIKPAEKGGGSVLNGILKLQAYTIVIHPSCENLIEEVQNYSWRKDKASGEYINQPVDEYNHSIDALRYSLQCYKGKMRTMDKNLLGL